eukprot:6421525-Amphidinium_carterae.1
MSVIQWQSFELRLWERPGVAYDSSVMSLPMTLCAEALVKRWLANLAHWSMSSGSMPLQSLQRRILNIKHFL